MTNLGKNSPLMKEVIRKARLRADSYNNNHEKLPSQKSEEEIIWELYWQTFDDTITNEYRTICPCCGCTGKFIKEKMDRTRIIERIQGRKIYGRKFICMKDGYEWVKK
ncbi:MAG: hypothetical protein GF311_25860 [Candidatus Lokiarchaeota archaeon]|nr:hypothetical protein [Candidatus Lokiarchaeota archaeon]